MKKCVVFGLVIVLCALFTACKQAPIEVPTTNETSASVTTSIRTTTGTSTSVATSTQTTRRTFTPNDIEYGWSEQRELWYGVSVELVDLIGGLEVFDQWTKDKNIKFDDFHEMAVVQFVKRFNITKEQFEKATQTMIDYAKEDQRTGIEPYNADLIYTFDNERIREYYRKYDDEGNEIKWRELEPWNELLKP